MSTNTTPKKKNEWAVFIIALIIVIGVIVKLFSPKNNLSTNANTGITSEDSVKQFTDSLTKTLIPQVSLNTDINLKREDGEDGSAFGKPIFLYITNNDTFTYKKTGIILYGYKGEDPDNPTNLPYSYQLKTPLLPKHTTKFNVNNCNTGGKEARQGGVIYFNSDAEHIKSIYISAIDTSTVNNQHYMSLTHGSKTFTFHITK